jgi:hypothetical protein
MRAAQVAPCLLLLLTAAAAAPTGRKGPGGPGPKGEPAAEAKKEDAPPVSEGLGRVAEGMRKVKGGLVEGELGDPVLQEQRRVMTELEKLIRRTGAPPPRGGKGGGKEKKPQSQQPKPQPSSSPKDKQPKPVPDSGTGMQPGGGGRDGRSLLKGVRPESVPWGDLPYREREKVFQGLKESFPPKYRHLLEIYYRELAKP